MPLEVHGDTESQLRRRVSDIQSKGPGNMDDWG